MSQSTRAKNYRKFRNRIKLIARKFSHKETNPFGKDSVNGFFRYETQYNKLNARWRQWIDKRVERAIDEYHKPVVQGKNGKWYSIADMDHAMLRGW